MDKTLDNKGQELYPGCNVVYCTADGWLYTAVISRITGASVIMDNGHWIEHRRVKRRVLRLN